MHQHTSFDAENLFLQAENCIFLLRDPKYAIAAETKRFISDSIMKDSDSHTRELNITSFINQSDETQQKRIASNIKRYIRAWLTLYGERPVKCPRSYPVYYESLLTNREKELEGIVKFLQRQSSHREINTTKIECLRGNKVDHFQREKTSENLSWLTDLFPQEKRIYYSNLLENFKKAAETNHIRNPEKYFTLPDFYSFF